MVCNPEFLREGSAIDDFMRPDRVVIGSRDDPRDRHHARDLLAALALTEMPSSSPTSVESAELIKYASNAFLATKISFINEIARLCEALGADVETVARGMGLDRRIGPKFLHAGPGFGGSCFPKDTRAVSPAWRASRASTSRSSRRCSAANQETRERMVEKIRTALGDLEGRVVAQLGLSFKPETDDIRESPALFVLDGLLAGGARVRAFDPAAMDACRELYPSVEFCQDSYAAADGAEALVISTEWNQFRALELERLHKRMRHPLIVDLRNIYEPDRVAAAGFRYVSVGRPEADPGAGAPL